jgi:hypothetical protein
MPLRRHKKKMSTKKCEPPFNSEHNLDFLAIQWDITIGNDEEWIKFNVGTCHGLYRATDAAYEILAIINDEPGNGHLNDVFQWFEQSCRRDKKILRIREVWNAYFKAHLQHKRGFKPSGPDDMVKSFL